jgi:hypothetical protein
VTEDIPFPRLRVLLDLVPWIAHDFSFTDLQKNKSEARVTMKVTKD